MHSSLHYNNRNFSYIPKYKTSLMSRNGGKRESLDLVIIQHRLNIDLIGKRTQPRPKYLSYCGLKIDFFFKAFIALFQFFFSCHFKILLLI